MPVEYTGPQKNKDCSITRCIISRCRDTHYLYFETYVSIHIYIYVYIYTFKHCNIIPTLFLHKRNLAVPLLAARARLHPTCELHAIRVDAGEGWEVYVYIYIYVISQNLVICLELVM